ncbi:hypothetical protein [Erythrobacter sp.]|uniref:hypothetical protein n=1 Tax=Erythrobacter sp. TaxID=1042 RepID=UPI001425FF4F|nr:hypothetical protein [Erythrobacter sp.]QIQ87084.1 MAG: hypothetical protein G9473_10600 [Erythrobacter sp.]
MTKEKTVRLYSDQNAQSRRTIDLTLRANGSIRLEAGDVGPLVERMFGDGDYEFWVTVEPDAVAALCFALLQDRFSGDANAIDHLRSFCEAEGVRCDFGSWA